MAKDKCIMCDKETAYDFETHIDMRYGYVEGEGQLCAKCYTKNLGGIVYNQPIEVLVSEDTIMNTPNDFELGEKIRQAYWKIKGI